MQYDWIDFYTEFATKLLSLKNDRKTLIQKIYAVYAAVGISVPKLESGGEIIDIDPFTIFGTFNKGITDANRIAILGGIAVEFGMFSKVPSNFDGIPVLNNLSATFYGFKDDQNRMILKICGNCLRRLLNLLTTIQKKIVGDFQRLMIRCMINLVFGGTLQWGFIGFVLIHLSIWIPEIAGL